MSWNTKRSCPNITAMLDSGACTVADMVKEGNLKTALKEQIPKLAEFLIANSGELVDIALGVEKVDYNLARSICFSIIITPMKSFTGPLIASDDFLDHINSFITDEKDIEDDDATAFAKIFQFIIQQSNGSVLNRWPQREELFQKILDHMDRIAIHTMLEDMSTDGKKAVVAFLEDNHASEVILSNVTTGDLRKNRKLYLYLANIVYGLDIDSPLLSAFESVQKMEEIYELAFVTPSSKLSAQIFSFLHKLLDQCIVEDEDEEFDPENEDPLIESVVKLGYNKISRICDFLQKDSPFLSDKKNASYMMTAILMRSETIPDCVYKYARYLFNQIFENPAHSILHQTFYSLFERLLKEQSSCIDFINETDMKHRIQEAFEKRDEINASYWGVLFMLSNKIAGITFNKEDSAWQKFQESTISKTQSMLDNAYGGKLPNEYESDSEDFEFPLGRSQLQNIE